MFSKTLVVAFLFISTVLASYGGNDQLTSADALKAYNQARREKKIKTFFAPNKDLDAAALTVLRRNGRISQDELVKLVESKNITLNKVVAYIGAIFDKKVPFLDSKEVYSFDKAGFAAIKDRGVALFVESTPDLYDFNADKMTEAINSFRKARRLGKVTPKKELDDLANAKLTNPNRRIERKVNALYQDDENYQSFAALRVEGMKSEQEALDLLNKDSESRKYLLNRRCTEVGYATNDEGSTLVVLLVFKSD